MSLTATAQNVANTKSASFDVTYTSLKLYPNPVVSNAVLEFKLAENAQVQVTLLNILGAQVKNLVNEPRTPGNQSVQFSANQLERGTYFIRLVINGEIIKTIRIAVSPIL
ncbi:MAG: T9SS type A sorting domain-containing protein [Saprospiraceae bacterium]